LTNENININYRVCSLTKYIKPITKDFKINYRAGISDAYAEQLKFDGLSIADKIETFDNDRFVYIINTKLNLGNLMTLSGD
jgi:hypothetical protein